MRSSERSRGTAVLGVLLLAWAVPAAAQDPAVARATLPLEQVLELHRKAEREPTAPEQPPVDATLRRLELRGRVLDDALELRAELEVGVLARDRWVAVPLLRVHPTTQLAELPKLSGASFAVREGQLQLLTRRAGHYAFGFALRERAAVQGARREVVLEPAPAVQTSLILVHDRELFQLDAPGARTTAEGAELQPDGGPLQLAWTRIRAAPAATRAAAPRAEPVVTLAHGSAVDTLEGQRITRWRYELRFTGQPELVLQLPAGPRLERVYLNGHAIPATPEGNALSLQVTPARDGDARGDLELVLSETRPGFNLSGSLAFAAPSASWPVNELFLAAHLPQVFDYAWRGGSLSPVERGPQARFVHALPLPGQRLSFHQFLIGRTSPDVTLEYQVSLEGQYHR